MKVSLIRYIFFKIQSDPRQDPIYEGIMKGKGLHESRSRQSCLHYYLCTCTEKFWNELERSISSVF